MRKKKIPYEEICIRKMKNTDDYERVCKMIYKADEYIYPDLLGKNEKLACRALKFLLDDPKSMFYHENYIVAEHRGKIVGTAALHKGVIRWSPESVKAALAKAGIDIPVTFEHVSRYYSGVYGQDQSPRFKLRNVSVWHSHQKEGIGSRILEYIIGENGISNIELWVLSSNRAARHLYEKFGFKRDGPEVLEYGGFVERKVMAMKMVKN